MVVFFFYLVLKKQHVVQMEWQDGDLLRSPAMFASFRLLHGIGPKLRIELRRPSEPGGLCLENQVLQQTSPEATVGIWSG